MRPRFAFVLAVVLSLPVAARAADPTPFEKLVAQYEEPVLGTPVGVEDLEIRIDHLTLSLSGAVWPVLAGEDRIGLFFSGRGHYRYDSADAIETPLVLWEAKRLGAKASQTKAGSATEGDFETLYLLTGGVTLPELGSADVASEAAAAGLPAFAKHRKRFARAQRTPPAHLLVRERIDQPGEEVAVAEMGGGKDSIYLLDPIETKREGLFAVAPIWTPAGYEDLEKELFVYPISEQPLGWQHGSFQQPRFLLVDVDYQLVDHGDDSMSLAVTETVVPRERPLRVLRFDLVSGEWDSDLDFHSLVVDAVTDAAGKPLPYDHHRGSLLVGLGSPADKGQPVTIHFQLSGDVLLRPNGDNFWQLGTEAWLPRPPANGQYFTLHSVIEVRKGWTVFATGDTVARREEEKYDVLETRMEHPIQYPVVHAGKYHVIEETEDDLTIRVASYGVEKEKAMKKLAKLSRQLVQIYQPWLGPFPFKELTILEVNDLGWGQAPAGMMFITKEAFSPLLNRQSRWYSDGVNQRFAHEIAHQYWGSVVKSGSDEETWLSEGFAEYCSAVALQKGEGERAYEKMLFEWRGRAKNASDIGPVPLADRIGDPKDYEQVAEKRTGLLYSKSAWLLAVLRKEVGDEKFFLVMRNLQGLYAWRFLTTGDVISLFDRIDTGTKHAPFFDRYFWGTEMPKMPK